MAYQEDKNKKAAKEEQLEQLRVLFKKYNLSDADYWKSGHYTIITRMGFDKILAKEKDRIEIVYTLENSGIDFAHMRADGTLWKEAEDGTQQVAKHITTFASATPENVSGHGRYYLEMAEKRAKARCVLQLLDMYELGIYSQDEFDKDSLNSMKSKQHNSAASIDAEAKTFTFDA